MEQQINVDIRQTTAYKCVCGCEMFHQTVIIRKIPKFVVGAKEDQPWPIPAYMCVSCGSPLQDLLPASLKTTPFEEVVEEKPKSKILHG